MKELESLKAKFFKAYANLPEPEKEQVIAVIGDRTYSWEAASREISNNTRRGSEILEKMKRLGIL